MKDLDQITAKLTIMVQEGFIESKGIITKNIIKFMESIVPGTLLLIEYPISYYRNSTGGIRSFNVTVTNLDTLKSLNIKGADIERILYKNIENFKIIE